MAWNQIADRVLAGASISRAEALPAVSASDGDLIDLLAAAYKLRRHYHGNRVKLNMLINAKSGLCPEDCGYCSQSIVANAGVDRYSLQSADVLVEGARQALANKAHTYCIVISGRRPSLVELERITQAVRRIKGEFPLRICCCLGLLDDAEVHELRQAGVDRVNHNLNTSEDYYGEVCSTHDYADRVGTVEAVKRGGISTCSGAIVGMGETDEQIVDTAFALRDLDVDSIPINFLVPIAGTSLGHLEYLTPQKCLAILCMFRLVNPAKELRIAGGREYHLRSLQPMGLYVADSIFIGDYLTTRGEIPERDLEMIQDAGFVPDLPPGLAPAQAFPPAVDSRDSSDRVSTQQAQEVPSGPRSR